MRPGFVELAKQNCQTAERTVERISREIAQLREDVLGLKTYQALTGSALDGLAEVDALPSRDRRSRYQRNACHGKTSSTPRSTAARRCAASRRSARKPQREPDPAEHDEAAAGRFRRRLLPVPYRPENRQRTEVGSATDLTLNLASRRARCSASTGAWSPNAVASVTEEF